MSPDERREAARFARARATFVLRTLRIASPAEIDVEGIAAHHDLFVRDGGLVGAQGRLVVGVNRGLIRVASRVQQRERRRYVIAHELGHYLLHARKRKVSFCTDGDLVSYDTGSSEAEANWFASELLMPEEWFGRRCDVAQPSLTIVSQLARDFTTSLTAAAIRFVELCPERCAVVWAVNGRIVWAVRGPEFGMWIPTGRALHSDTYASDAFRGCELPDAPESVLAAAWLEQDSGDLYEHSLYAARLNATLTLLWSPLS